MDFRSLHRRMRGITLIELLTVVIILGVLASIAVPTYRRYLIRAQRSEAKIALLQLQTAQEKYYSQFNRYTDKVTQKTSAKTPGLGLPGTTETGKYVVSVINLGPGAQTYTGIASPTFTGGQADDKDCGAFMINERGVRSNSWKGQTKNAQSCWK